MAQRIYREWFVEFRYPGHEGVPLVDSELGPLPATWRVGTLGTLVEVNANTIRKVDADEAIRYIDIASVAREWFSRQSTCSWEKHPDAPVVVLGVAISCGQP